MMKLKIYGSSDDLIEIDGAVNEEFNFYPDGPNDVRYLAVSDGSLFRVRYDEDGIWRIDCIVAGYATISKTSGDVSKDTNDVVALESEYLQWVALANYYALAKRK